jgi:hypothetical protein
VHGYKIEFIEPPYQIVPARTINFSFKEENIMALEIQTLLTKGVIVPSQDEPNQFISNVFLRDKKEQGKYRMIFNLTKLNDFVKYHHFKMETLDTALHMVTPGAFLGSLDFVYAYYTLPVHEAHQKYFKFHFQRQLYNLVSVPMGLSSACRFFTKVLKVPLCVLRKNMAFLLLSILTILF